MSNVLEIACKISTPQFAGGRVHHYHQQQGIFNTKTFLFTPTTKFLQRANNIILQMRFVTGDHSVQFGSMEDFKTALVEVYD